MKNFMLHASVALAMLIGTCGVSRVQAQAAGAKSGSFDPHDLNGVWVRKGRPRPAPGTTPPPAPPAGLDEKLRPPFTAWGQQQFDAHIPTVGPRVQPGKENDPTMRCDPDGFPKIFTSPEPFEIVMANKRRFQFFENDPLWREIWLDLDESLPRIPNPHGMEHRWGTGRATRW